jgi:transposase InsO family protein
MAESMDSKGPTEGQPAIAPDPFALLFAVKVNVQSDNSDYQPAESQPSPALQDDAARGHTIAQTLASPQDSGGGAMGSPIPVSIPTQTCVKSENIEFSHFFDVFDVLDNEEAYTRPPKGGGGFPLASTNAIIKLEDPQLVLQATTEPDYGPGAWILDSGATVSATFSAEDCINIMPCNISVTAAGCTFIVDQKGTAVIRAADENGALQTLYVNDCLISSRFPYKLLALPTFTAKGFTINMVGNALSVLDSTNKVALTGFKDIASRLYVLRLFREETEEILEKKEVNMLLAKSYGGSRIARNAPIKSAKPSDALLWSLHLKHGHRNFRDLCRQYGMTMPSVLPSCASCVMGKSHVHPHLSDGFERAKRRGEGFHTDFRGPFSVATPSGHVYFLSIIDDHSRRIFPFLCKSQDEWYDIWIRFVARIEAEIGRPNCISWLLSDNGSVYNSHAMIAFCAEKGIRQRFSAPYSQWMNHCAERNMRTVGEMTVTTLIHGNLPKRAWGWATLHACEVINRTIEKAAGSEKLPNMTRLERWKGVALPGQTKGLYPFGCLAFKHIPAITRNKLDCHANPMVYLGIDSASRSYLLGSLFDLVTSVAVEVTFLEDVFPFRNHRAEDSPASLLWDSETSLTQGDPRLGMFSSKLDPSLTHLDKNALKSIGISPQSSSRGNGTPSQLTAFSGHPSGHVNDRSYSLRSQNRKQTTSSSIPVVQPTSAPMAVSPSLSNHGAATPRADGAATFPQVSTTCPDLPHMAKRPRDVWEPFVSPPAHLRAGDSTPAEGGYPPLDSPTEHKAFLASCDPDTLCEAHLGEGFAHPDSSSIEVVLSTVTEATLQTITPRNVLEALRSPQRKMWLLAMQREKDCHIKNGTFGEEAINNVRLAPDRKPIPADWVFKIKHRGGPINVSDLTERQFKARVVIRGQFMKAGLDFNDTFAPVAKPTTVRALLAFATSKGYLLKSGDVETAFLTADMDCEVHVRMPPFWGGKSGPIDPTAAIGKARLLLKGVPGIPQGSRLFYETFSTFLISIGFKVSHADKCLFFLNVGTECIAILLWVDDFILLCEYESTFSSILAKLRSKFTIPTACSLTCFLGMEIKYDSAARTMQLLQSSTTLVLLERAKMLDCNSVQTPCPTGVIFTNADCPAEAGSNTTTTEFRSLIALANFLSCWTRPDITFTVNKLCKYMANPGTKHWQLLKHLLRYLKGTQHLGITFNFNSPSSGGNMLAGYTDSSFADCPDTGRSTLAYNFFYGPAILSWYSKLGTYVTTSTNHSEYNALALGAKEAEWLLLLFSQLDSTRTLTPVPIFVDNSGIVSMVFNPVDHQANKHVRVSLHYTRELADRKIIVPVKIPTEDNIADIFTKPLAQHQFKLLSSKFMAAAPTLLNNCTPIPITSAPHSAAPALPRATATIMMMTAHDDNEGDDDEPEHVESKQTADFQANWAYADTYKKLIGACSYDVNTTGLTFKSSGREKLEVVFYRPSLNGKIEMSRHDAFRLYTKGEGRPYVCVARQPNQPSPPAIPNAPPPATIHITQPAPTLTCCKCGMINTIAFALLECTSCNGRAFDWSCACVPRPGTTTAGQTSSYSTPPRPATSAPPSLLPSYSPPPHPSYSSSSPEPLPAPMTPSSSCSTTSSTPLTHSRRTPRKLALTKKTWSEQIKYVGPLGRYTTYHKLDCFTLAPGQALIATIEFANAYQMKPAACCYPVD